jgi:ABC-2 type transport system permease protein
MRDFFRLLRLFLRVGIMNELQYRANFFVRLAQTLIALATGLIVLSLVFSHTDTLAGWSRFELYVVMGVHILLGGLIGMFIQPNMLRLMEDIQQGNLDFLLTKPENAQLLASVRETHIWQLVDVITGVVVIGWGLWGLGRGISAESLALFLFLLLLGVILMYSFWLLIASIAFWVIQLSDIVTIWGSMFQAGRWPVGLYPGWLRTLLTFLVPVAFAVTVPAEALTQRLDLTQVLFAIALTAAIFLIARLVWQRGLRNYSGASA